MSVFRNYQLQEALRAWDAEVEAEMVRLIEKGVPPFDAVVQARDTVTRRRRSGASQKGDREPNE